MVLSTRLALYLLGAPRLELGNAPVTADRRKTLALLAYLAVNRWQHHRDHISALLWPDYDQPKAYTNLRHILWEVGQVLGDGWLVARRDTIGLIPEEDDSSSLSGAGRTIWLDVARFKSLINESRAQKEAARRIPLLLESVNLYRNHFLTGFSLKHSPVFNEWAVTESEELQHQLTRALTMLVTDYCSLKKPETAVQHAQRLVALDPLNEASHRQLMQVYIQAGQNGAALKQYQTCEQILRRELGVDPQPETRLLYRQIRKGEIKPIQPVKQIEMGAPGHNLPFQISKFIGREKELNAITDLIAEHRLVTLTGTGGIGKTRLALKAGEQLLNEYANGVWFVELASLSDPTLVPQTLAQLFHIAEQADEPLTQKLARVLRSRTFLIILDNCEHLLDASAQLVDALLKNCPNLKVLVTSREPLRITGEAQYHVPSLGLPDLQQLLEKMLEYESIQLFEERARLVQKDFSMTMENASSISQICHRLDGIPLAIELAAARVDMLSTEQIAARLDESLNLLTGGSRTALSRQQTLRASIDWSWNLLSDSERTLLRRLAVFAGGWTLEGAEAVGAGHGVYESEVFGLLSNLVKKSLVSVNSDTGRYHMLETIRQYAHEKLREAGEGEEIRDQHLRWVLNWVEEIELEFQGRNQIARLNQTDQELDNIRQAMEWGLNTGQPESSMRVFVALRYYLDGRNSFNESRQWLKRGLSFGERLSKATLARGLMDAAWFAYRQNDPEDCVRCAQKGLDLVKEINDPTLSAYAFRTMGVAQLLVGNFDLAKESSEKSFFLYKEAGRIRDMIAAVGNLAQSQFYRGNLSGANDLLESNLILLDDIDDQYIVAYILFLLGGVKVLLSQFEQAHIHLRKALLLYHKINNIFAAGLCFVGFAGAANGYKNPVRAARILGAREAIHDSMGANLDPGVQRFHATFLAETRALLSESEFETAWAEGRAMTMEQAIEYALNEE